ncbi:hypothetical protein I4U23_029251 [Adineta vaga]|nr:hypothetical protein I4U23_029251 [Adineta vaga]
MLFQFFVCTCIFSMCFADIDETLIYCKSPPPKLTNGIIKRDRVSYYTGKGYLGSMEYMCLPGFNLLGNKIVTCQNGIWSTMTQCIPKKRCAPIKSYPKNTIIESNNVAYFQNDPQQIIVGSTIVLRCMDYYEFDSTSGGSLHIECQNDGSWTPMPSCKPAEGLCNYSKLYLPSGSRITRMNFKFSEHNRQLHAVGSNLEYTCEDGYRLHDGQTSLIVECLESGSWSPLPVCEFVYHAERPIRCSYPVYIKNGYMILYNVTIWEDQTYTGEIVYECNYGFETLDGNDQMRSECINGSWTNVTDCREILTCSKQDLLNLESQVENSYVYNVSLQYIHDPLAFVYDSYVLRECLPNFEHDPSSPPLKIRCQRDTNTWTGIPICRAIETMTTEMISADTDEFISLNDNLILLMENTTKKSFQTTSIEPESSSGSSIACHSNDIPFLPNADIVQSPLNTTYDVGTILYYQCQPGYSSSFNQSNYTICSMNGTWSLDAINTVMCQLNYVTTEEVLDQTSTIIFNTTTEYNTASDLDDDDDDLSVMNISNKSSISSIRSISAGDRQVRHISSYCKELPKIEYAQLLSDDTIKHNRDNEVTIRVHFYSFVNLVL